MRLLNRGDLQKLTHLVPAPVTCAKFDGMNQRAKQTRTTRQRGRFGNNSRRTDALIDSGVGECCKRSLSLERSQRLIGTARPTLQRLRKILFGAKAATIN